MMDFTNMVPVAMVIKKQRFHGYGMKYVDLEKTKSLISFRISIQTSCEFFVTNG